MPRRLSALPSERKGKWDHPAAKAVVFYSLLTAAVAAGVLALVVLPYATLGFTDDDILALYYLHGRPYPPPLWPDQGRFFPLGHQEWRLLYFWTNDVAIYHLWRILEYAAFSLGVIALLKEIGHLNWLSVLLVITLPPVMVSYANIVMPEGAQVFLMPWLTWALVRWDRVRRLRYAALALMCANLMLYQKEPTFLFIATLAGLRLTQNKASRVDLALIASSVAFLATYLIAIPSGSTYHGATAHLENMWPTAAAWVQQEPLLFPLLLGAVLVAAARLLAKRPLDAGHQLGLAAIPYVLALLATGLVSTFYAALPMAAAALSLAPRLPRPVAALAIAAGILLTIPHFLYRQDWVTRNAELASQIAYMSPVRLTGHAYDAEEFAVYTDAFRNLSIIFYTNDERYAGKVQAGGTCDYDTGFCITYSPDPTRAVVDLGQLDSSRPATLLVDGKDVWRYDSRRLQDLLALTPTWLHEAIRPQYNLW
jgi:hypothetical protein